MHKVLHPLVLDEHLRFFAFLSHLLWTLLNRPQHLHLFLEGLDVISVSFDLHLVILEPII